MSRIERPFVMESKQKDGNPLVGNNRFEVGAVTFEEFATKERTETHYFCTFVQGFCVDMLEQISELVGFNYVIELVPDRNYGAKNLTTGEWNGLVKELMDGTADIAIGAMTINFAREEVIDFTKPFMNLGISILFKIPSGKPTRLFSFMNPLAVEIWLYVLAAYVMVSFTLFVMARYMVQKNRIL